MKLDSQAVGAFGERTVEAELLRRGWIPANVNATVKNAADFDIYALKRGRTDRSVLLRVKTCGPDVREFQFGGFAPGKPVKIEKFSDSDFTILVSMADKRDHDEFYVVPSRLVRKEVALRQRDWMRVSKRDGGKRKDVGLWVLRLRERRDGHREAGYGLQKKWAKYLGAWSLLEHD